uniref:sortase n=1 Tax=Anaerobutyricum hallii TaxID=39488 RepID=UPI003FEE7AC7
MSAHRGLPSAKLFTDLDKMEVGDTFTITILNREITYEVDDISIVLPDETDSLQIEDKKDYCTLMTCTPYGINTHRLLVRGHCIGTGEPQHIHVTVEAFQIDPTITASVMGIILLIMLLIRVLIRTRKKGQEGKHLKRNQVFLHLKRGDLIGNNKKTK